MFVVDALVVAVVGVGEASVIGAVDIIVVEVILDEVVVEVDPVVRVVGWGLVCVVGGKLISVVVSSGSRSPIYPILQSLPEQCS